MPKQKSKINKWVKLNYSSEYTNFNGSIGIVTKDWQNDEVTIKWINRTESNMVKVSGEYFIDLIFLNSKFFELIS